MKLKSILILCLLLGAAIFQNARAGDKVLIVHSYHEAFDWTGVINQAITSALQASRIPYRVFFMDTKRKPDEGWKKESARQAKQLLETYQPTVVIAVDDNAQAHFVKDYVDRSPIQFVFCGVNADPWNYGYPASNVTGMLERTYPDQTLKALQTLLPAIRNVALISDNSPSSDLVIRRIRSMMQVEKAGVRIVSYDQPHTFSAWKKIIIDLDENPQVDALVIPLYHTLQQSGSRMSVEPREVMAWTLAHTRKPLVGIGTFFVGHGGLLAVTADPLEHGRVAAGMALEILKGKSAADIPVVINQEGKVLVNLKHNSHLPFDVGVDIDQLADVIIR